MDRLIVGMERNRKRMAEETVDPQEIVAEIAEAANSMKSVMEPMLSELNKMQAQLEEMAEKFHVDIRELMKKTGFVKMRNKLIRQAKEAMEMGEVFESAGVTLEKRLSKRPSYQIGFTILASLVNQQTFAKFSREVMSEMLKVKAILRTGVKELDFDDGYMTEEAKKLLSDKVQILAERHGISTQDTIKVLDELKKTPEGKAMLAFSLSGTLKDAYRAIKNGLVGVYDKIHDMVANAIENLIDNLTGADRKMERINEKAEKLIDELKMGLKELESSRSASVDNRQIARELLKLAREIEG
jgi:endonuclease III